MKPEFRGPLLWPTIVLAVCALISGALLLVLDCFFHFPSSHFHGAVSAAPLIFISLSWLCLHPGTRVSPVQFLKRLIAAIAFVLWGIDQILPPGPVASTVGDVVIALFVLDLALIIKGELTEDPND